MGALHHVKHKKNSGRAPKGDSKICKRGQGRDTTRIELATVIQQLEQSNKLVNPTKQHPLQAMYDEHIAWEIVHAQGTWGTIDNGKVRVCNSEVVGAGKGLKSGKCASFPACMDIKALKGMEHITNNLSVLCPYDGALSDSCCSETCHGVRIPGASLMVDCQGMSSQLVRNGLVYVPNNKHPLHGRMGMGALANSNREPGGNYKVVRNANCALVVIQCTATQKRIWQRRRQANSPSIGCSWLLHLTLAQMKNSSGIIYQSKSKI